MWELVQEDGMWVLRLGDVIDSRWHSEGAATQRLAMLQTPERALVAAAGPSDGRPFYAVLCVDEIGSADGRYFEHFEWEQLPLTLFAMDTQPDYGGHAGSVAVGSIRTIERLSDNRRIFATGFLNTTEEATETEAQIESQTLRFVSVDPADYDYEEEITKIGTDGWPLDGILRFTRYVIGGATVLGTPALRLAVIWLDGMDAPVELAEPLPEPVAPTQIPEIVDVEEDRDIMVILASARGEAEPLEQAAIVAEDREMRSLLAGALAERQAQACVLTEECGGPALPPAEWFADPNLSEPTPLTITSQGRIFGHVALWDQPHRGFLHYTWSENVFAPRSSSGYQQFMCSTTPVACCEEPGCGHERQVLRTGVLTVGTLHAGRRLSAAAAQAFYENTGLQAADVCAGDDAFGPWIAGSLRPGLDDARVREVLGSQPSGDWRWIGGQLELCAVLGVNTGGFPIAASAYVEEGQVRTLIAGWAPPLTQPVDEALVASLARRSVFTPSQRREAEQVMVIDRARWERMEADLAALRPLVAERLEHEFLGEPSAVSASS